MTDTLKTVQALAHEIAKAAFDEGVAHGKGAKNFCGSNGKVFALIDALIEQMQREAVQPALCRHEPYQGRCIHCDVPFRNGRAVAAPHPEAQALDSQLQQPDGHSTPCVEAASTVPAQAASPRTKRKLVGYGDCRCVLTQYCDGKCRPIFADVPIPDAPSRKSEAGDQKQDVQDLTASERIAQLEALLEKAREALRMFKDAAIDMRGLDFNLTTEQWARFHEIDAALGKEKQG